MVKQALPSRHGRPAYSVLDPIVDLLIANGNKVITEPRWCSNPTGYYCLMESPIDIALVESHFLFPESVQVIHELGHIDYGLGTAVIRQA